MNPSQVAQLFRLEDPYHPNYRMVRAVLAILIGVASTLPEEHRPGPPRGPWQVEIIRSVLAHVYNVVKGSAQACGKTFILALIGVCYLLLGASVGIVMPSLKQGSRILHRRIAWWMAALEPVFGLQRDKDEAEEKIWNNGAVLVSLTSNPEAQQSIHGYTMRVLLFDEGEEGLWADLGNVIARCAIALKRGIGKVIISGYGGPEASAIEMAQAAGYATCWYDDVRIAAMDREMRAAMAPEDPRLAEAPWEDFFAQQERDHPETYDQLYRLLPLLAGGRKLFPTLLRSLPRDTYDWTPVQFFTWDVGDTHDRTLGSRWLVWNDAWELADSLAVRSGSFSQQARQAAGWMLGFVQPRIDWWPHNTAVECNGLGKGFADALAEIDPFRGLTRVMTTDSPPRFKKSRWLNNVRGRAERKILAVADRDAYNELAPLQFEVTAEGRFKWPHNDYLTTVWLTERLRGSSAAGA